MLRAVVLTQYRRLSDRQTDGETDGQTDGQTDGIAIASTALAMRALRRSVKNLIVFVSYAKEKLFPKFNENLHKLSHKFC